MTKAQRAKAIKMFDARIAVRLRAGKSTGRRVPLTRNRRLGLGAGWSGHAPLSLRAGAPRVIGKDWLSVIATPPSPQVAAAVKAMVSSRAGTREPVAAGLLRQLVFVGLIVERL